MAKEPSRRAPGADRILDAALQLAAEMPWRAISMEMIAERAGATLARVHGFYPSKPAILRAFFRRVDEQVLKEHDFGDRDEPPRERLLDVLLRRLDVLGRHRDAMRSIWRDTACDPVTLLYLAPSMGKAMAWSLEAAGIMAWGPGGLLRVKGLAAIFASALPVWLRDETQDLGPTTAYLDRNLRRAESFARTMCPSPRRAPES